MLLLGWRLRSAWTDFTRRRRLKVLAGASASAVITALFLPNALEWKSDSPYLDSVRGVVNYKEGSGAGRLVQYRNSLRMAVANPVLGVGPGNWAVEYPKFAVRNDPSLNDEGMTSNPWPSSDWVAFLAERGFAAVLLFAMALFGLLVGAWIRARACVDGPRASRRDRACRDGHHRDHCRRVRRGVADRDSELVPVVYRWRVVAAGKTARDGVGARPWSSARSSGRGRRVDSAALDRADRGDVGVHVRDDDRASVTRCFLRPGQLPHQRAPGSVVRGSRRLQERSPVRRHRAGALS